MQRKRIGFVQSSSGECEDNSITHVSLEKSSDKERVVRDFIATYFSVDGDARDKEFRTSAELAYMMREYGTIPAALVSRIMTGLQYGIKFIDGFPNWVIFMKDQGDYPD
ncbi:MAG: hypothetical protein LBQ74_15270 [Prevotella sp.]|jgi:hypothetical protein|nr:hypothetical protein [Prevotella sp.]